MMGLVRVPLRVRVHDTSVWVPTPDAAGRGVDVCVHGTGRRDARRRIERGMGTQRAFVVVVFACVVAHAFDVREVEVRCVRARTPLERLKKD